MWSVWAALRMLCAAAIVVGVSAGLLLPVRRSIAASADYPNATLVSYGIPESVVQVVCDNSLMENGDTPCASGITAQGMTVADVQEMTVFSLAQRTAVKGGSSTTAASRSSSVVAEWIKNQVAAAAKVWGANASNPERILTADQSRADSPVVLRSDLWSAPSTVAQTLTDGVAQTSGSTSQFWNEPYPVVNVLMAVASSASNASVVDLTGILSDISIDDFLPQRTRG